MVVVQVLLVEDHAIFRQLFASAFDNEPDFEVVGQAGTLAEARETLRDLAGRVDVAVVDLHLPDGDGMDLIGELREGNPHGAVLVLTASVDLGTYARAITAGAAGVVHKSGAFAGIMDAVRRLSAGEALLSQEEVVELLRVADPERTEGREARRAFQCLTSREKDVLEALAEGLGDKEIAITLGVGVGTVRGYVAGLLQKLGVHSRLQALVFAARHGFVEIDSQDRGVRENS